MQREKVFAEICYDHGGWEKVSQEEESPIVTFFPLA